MIDKTKPSPKRQEWAPSRRNFPIKEVINPTEGAFYRVKRA